MGQTGEGAGGFGKRWVRLLGMACLTVPAWIWAASGQTACPAGTTIRGVPGGGQQDCTVVAQAPAAIVSTILSLLLDDQGAAVGPSLPDVMVPLIDRFELVASDGGGTYIWNSWGWHQPRITRHADGSVRLVYNVLNARGGDSWRLMKRQGEAGPWVLEATGDKFDDAFLLRDPVSDRAHVVTSPNSVRTVYSSPDFVPAMIPGVWPFSSNAARQYSGAGIGQDGTLCYKAYDEGVSVIENANTLISYICGRLNAAGSWKWNAKVDQYIGQRYAYDYLFPGVQAGIDGFVATAQRDVHKIAAGWPSAVDNYVFDGVRLYRTGYASNAGWSQSEIVPASPSLATAPVAPVQRQYDAFVDSGNRMHVITFREHPADARVRGFYITVSDMSGTVILNRKLNVPEYGFVRLFESSNGRLWLMWAGGDTNATQLFLYPVTVSLSPVFDLLLSGYTDLSAVVAPYRLQANMFFAVPRGGNQKNNFIDGMVVACGTALPAACGGKDRIFYFRLRMP